MKIDLRNKIAMQIKFLTISDKPEKNTIDDLVSITKEYAEQVATDFCMWCAENKWEYMGDGSWSKTTKSVGYNLSDAKHGVLHESEGLMMGTMVLYEEYKKKSSH